MFFLERFYVYEKANNVKKTNLTDKIICSQLQLYPNSQNSDFQNRESFFEKKEVVKKHISTIFKKDVTDNFMMTHFSCEVAAKRLLYPPWI